MPILDDGFVLPESAVIMEYLEERYPSPALLPADLAARAAARLAVFRFDTLLGDDYYAARRGDPNELTARLEALPVGLSLLSDFAFVPWVIRARDRLGSSCRHVSPSGSRSCRRGRRSRASSRSSGR